MRDSWSDCIVAKAFSAIERINLRFSKHGTPRFFDGSLFPWSKLIEDNWAAIRRELDAVLKFRQHIPNFQDISEDQRAITQDDGWKTFFLYAYGSRNDDGCRLCPATARVLKRIPGMTTAYFSILAPHKHLPMHRGPYNGVLRYHLGLRVAQPDKCGISVGGESRGWSEGASLIFDDTYQHEAWNGSNETRVVLFVDFLRPLPWPMSLINRSFVWLFGQTGFVQEGLKKIKPWNKKMLAAFGGAVK